MIKNKQSSSKKKKANILQDSATVQMDYHYCETNHIEEGLHYLGEYTHRDTQFFLSMTQKFTLLISFITVLVVIFAFYEQAMLSMLFIGSMLHFILSIMKHHLFFSKLQAKFSKLRDKYLKNTLYEYNDRQADTDEQLPQYSILLPIFMEEKNVIEQLLLAMKKLDYPKEQMKVLIVLESIDIKTIQNIRAMKIDSNYQLIIVPDFAPRTKAKACNYAMQYVQGDYLVIYDTDDIPAPDQLRVAMMKFKESTDAQLACLQAKLNYYNADENLLTRLFSLEYAILFDKILPALAQAGSPLPLGGTSNHFKVDVLKKLHGWDIYNLAEDAEIGMRLAINGYKTDTIDSYTAEEAPITVLAWIKQRSRWLKGFIQTYFLYMQKKHNLTESVGGRNSFMSLHFMLGLSTLSLILTPLMIIAGISLQYVDKTIDIHYYNSSITFTCIISTFWIISSFLQSYKTLKTSPFLNTLSKFKQLICLVMFPLYFTLHTVAAFYAVIDIVRRPFYWSRTQHGLTKKKHSF